MIVYLTVTGGTALNTASRLRPVRSVLADGRWPQAAGPRAALIPSFITGGADQVDRLFSRRRGSYRAAFSAHHTALQSGFLPSHKARVSSFFSASHGQTGQLHRTPHGLPERLPQ